MKRTLGVTVGTVRMSRDIKYSSSCNYEAFEAQDSFPYTQNNTGT